jgi:ribonuclease E
VLVGSPTRCRRKSGLVTSCLLIVASASFVPIHAFAQQAATTNAAPADTRDDHAEGRHHDEEARDGHRHDPKDSKQPEADRGERDRRDGKQPEADRVERDRRDGKQPEADRVGRDRRDGKQAERDRDERKRRDAIHEKVKNLDAAVKKTTRDQLMKEQRRREALRLTHDRDDGRDGMRPDIAMTKETAKGDARPDRPRHQGPPPIPASVRAATMDAPSHPHGAQPPKPTVLGGAAPYDPKKGAVIDGTAMHHKL